MLNNDGLRELVYTVKVDAIEPLPGYDRVESATVGGWKLIVPKGQFKPGDYGVYFEIDSRVPEVEPFLFLAKRKFKIKTQKMCKSISQGLLMGLDDFIINGVVPQWVVDIKEKIAAGENAEHIFLTETLKVVYASDDDNKRKSDSGDQYKAMAARKPNIFKRRWARWFMRREWGRKLMFLIFGRKRDKKTGFPTKFPYIKKTDQERCENMPWVLKEKCPYIVTEKCDGSSATYILERKPLGRYEFYVCSRNVRQLNQKQKCFYDDNYYWEMAIKYDIENKLKDYLKKHSDLSYVCWQGEVCGPGIQKNPHKLAETHLFLFHMIDSEVGKYDIVHAKTIWDYYKMESVPITQIGYILPDDFEEFKKSADGHYSSSVVGEDVICAREGFVYYKIGDPNFHFKNVSRKYLLKHSE